MLDEKDLLAIAQLMDMKLEKVESRIVQGVSVLMDAEFKKQYHLLVEAQENALVHAATDDDLAIVEGRIDDLEAVTRVHTKDIERLKKAN